MTGTWVTEDLYDWPGGYCESCRFLIGPTNDDWAWPSYFGFVCFTAWTVHAYRGHPADQPIHFYKLAPPKCA